MEFTRKSRELVTYQITKDLYSSDPEIRNNVITHINDFFVFKSAERDLTHGVSITDYH